MKHVICVVLFDDRRYNHYFVIKNIVKKSNNVLSNSISDTESRTVESTACRKVTLFYTVSQYFESCELFCITVFSQNETYLKALKLKNCAGFESESDSYDSIQTEKLVSGGICK